MTRWGRLWLLKRISKGREVMSDNDSGWRVYRKFQVGFRCLDIYLVSCAWSSAGPQLPLSPPLFFSGRYTPGCCTCLGFEDRLVLPRKAFQGWNGSRWTSETAGFMSIFICLHRKCPILKSTLNFLWRAASLPPPILSSHMN